MKIILFLKQKIPNWNFITACEINLWLISGSMIILWLIEIINEYGLGNGISFFFYLQLISNISEFFQQFIIEQKNAYILIGSLIFFLISLYGIVFIEQGVKKIPLTLSKSFPKKLLFLNLNYNYLPLRFNQAGVISIVLTVAVLQSIFYSKLAFVSSKIYFWGLYFLFIIYFSIFYSIILLDLPNLSNQLQKTTSSFLKLKPGFSTSFYLKETIERITFIGSILLSVFAIVLNILESTFNTVISPDISITTYLFLSIGIFLDLIREIENFYFFTTYK